eukprot:TRINITY_DN12475_c0_g1_i6.p1 TRINITY_DN12475_c0_g1~~TRINITY_DN12475_c0_g1_i6.p1  ORF type:complete len:658 (+),score=8.90 TRINITY_DN12475_c0_g1_i6:1369-3342(+)
MTETNNSRVGMCLIVPLPWWRCNCHPEDGLPVGLKHNGASYSPIMLVYDRIVTQIVPAPRFAPLYTSLVHLLAQNGDNCVTVASHDSALAWIEACSLRLAIQCGFIPDRGSETILYDRQYFIIISSLAGYNVTLQSPTGGGKSAAILLASLVELAMATFVDATWNSVINLVVPLEAIRTDGFMKLIGPNSALDKLFLERKDATRSMFWICETASGAHDLLEDDSSWRQYQRNLVVMLPIPGDMKECAQLLASGLWGSWIRSSVIDEVHLVVQWGYETPKNSTEPFRRELQVLEDIPKDQLLVCSATLSKRCMEVIREKFKTPIGREKREWIEPCQRDNVRIYVLDIKHDDQHHWIQFLLDSHSSDNILLSANAGTAIEATNDKDCGFAHDGRLRHFILSSNRKDVLPHISAVTDATTNAVIYGTSCISTGVNIPHINVAIICEGTSMADIVQRAGRVARSRDSVGYVYVLSSATQRGRIQNAHHMGRVKAFVTSEHCVNRHICDCFLQPPDGSAVECDNFLDQELHCNKCDVDAHERLQEKFRMYRSENLGINLGSEPAEEQPVSASRDAPLRSVASSVADNTSTSTSSSNGSDSRKRSERDRLELLYKEFCQDPMIELIIDNLASDPDGYFSTLSRDVLERELREKTFLSTLTTHT